MPAKKKPVAPWLRAKKVQEPAPPVEEVVPEPETNTPPPPKINLNKKGDSLKITTQKIKKTAAGRRPDYTHALIGLNVGDHLVFNKNRNIKAEVADNFRSIKFDDGTIVSGVDAAASYAHKQANLSPPKRIDGLKEWVEETTGTRLRALYEKVPTA